MLKLTGVYLLLMIVNLLTQSLIHITPDSGRLSRRMRFRTRVPLLLDVAPPLLPRHVQEPVCIHAGHGHCYDNWFGHLVQVQYQMTFIKYKQTTVLA